MNENTPESEEPIEPSAASVEESPNVPPSDVQAPHIPSKEETSWALGAHLSGLLGWIVPFANIVAPIIIWQIKKDEMPYAAQEAKEALNFQISFMIYALVAGVLCFVLIGFLLLPVLIIGEIVLTIMAGIAAGECKGYRYPFTIRFVD